MSSPSSPRLANSPAAGLQLFRREVHGHGYRLPELGHGHGRNTIVAAVERLALTPDPGAVGSLLSEPLQADRGQVFSRVIPHDPAGQPASYRGGARDTEGGASCGGEEALHLRLGTDQVCPVRGEGRKTALVGGEPHALQHGEDGGQPPAGLFHNLYRFLDLRCAEPGGQLEVVARRIRLETPVQVTPLLGPQIATLVGYADNGVVVRDARNRGGGDALVAYGDHRHTMTCHLGDDPRPGSGRHHDVFRLEETVVDLDPHHPAVLYREFSRCRGRLDPDSQILCGAAEGLSASPGI